MHDFLRRIDEFYVILKNIEDKSIAETVCWKIMRSIIAPIKVEENIEVSIQASIGYSHYPEDGVSTEDLFDNAITAVQVVKASGKNDVLGYTESMKTSLVIESQSRKDILENLRS